jgi:hypothetical protein
MPANGGLLRIDSRSPDSEFGHFRLGIADSLRPIFEIFPFLGDRGRRPGSIYTAWSSLQWNVVKFPALAAGSWECRTYTATRTRPSSMSAFDVRRAKAALSSGCKPHPAIAPAGSNRSSHGGNEVARAVQRPSSATRRAESRPSRISFGVKQMGARNAGNPHVACDVGGAGDVVWVGTPGPHRRASPRPYR